MKALFPVKLAAMMQALLLGDAADLALIFWDGQSKGTKHMIDYMGKLQKPHYIVPY